MPQYFLALVVLEGKADLFRPVVAVHGHKAVMVKPYEPFRVHLILLAQ